MTDNILITVKSRFRLFKQPHKVGDVIEMEDRPVIVIGIEDFELWGGTLTVWYTCQRLDITDYVSMRKAYEMPHMVELELTLRHDDERWNQIKLGRTHRAAGNTYKAMAWTEIKLKGTDLYVSFSAMQLHPLDRKEAKAKLHNERRKKLRIEVI